MHMRDAASEGSPASGRPSAGAAAAGAAPGPRSACATDGGPRLATLGRPGLGVITFDEAGGGVAYVARLLREALASGAEGQAWVLALHPSRHDRVATIEAALFGARLIAANAFARASWFLFGHAGIATAQARLPAAIRRPYAVQLHGTEVWEPALPSSLAGAALRIAPSRFTAQTARATHPGIGPIAVCPHGLLPHVAAPGGVVDRALVERVRPESALIIGRLWSAERRKGHDQLIECWPAVLERVPDAQLVVAGRGDDGTRLERKARDAGLGEHVLFCGYVSDATREALLARAAVFAMPSRQEGFGLVYLEAMRLGVPCVAATRDGAEEAVVDGETGFLVEQSDRKALADALVRLLTDRQLRQRMGEAGRRRYEREFTFERYRERLLALLAEHFAPHVRDR